jgi:methionyl aminopeptidase
VLGRGIATKTPQQVRRMRAAGLVVGSTLAALREAARPGVTLLDLDALARESLAQADATPSFLGYYGFPAVICASVNDEVVHGIPSDRVLTEGDLVSVDFGAIVEGWHSDSAVTIEIGEVHPTARRLRAVCEDALWAGIAAMRAGAWLRDIGTAVQGHVRSSSDFGVVEGYTGHGIGTEMHEDPAVPNVKTRHRGTRLRPGIVLAVEPMITAGDPETTVDADGWTVRTIDGSLAAHAEHTVAVTPAGPYVLSAPDGGRARLAATGAPCGADAMEREPGAAEWSELASPGRIRGAGEVLS